MASPWLSKLVNNSPLRKLPRTRLLLNSLQPIKHPTKDQRLQPSTSHPIKHLIINNTIMEEGVAVDVDAAVEEDEGTSNSSNISNLPDNTILLQHMILQCNKTQDSIPTIAHPMRESATRTGTIVTVMVTMLQIGIRVQPVQIRSRDTGGMQPRRILWEGQPKGSIRCTSDW